MFVIVTYDITNPRRLVKVHKRLKDFGVPVQYSVFECDLDHGQMHNMRQALLEIIEPDEDAVLVYPVCEDCRRKVTVSGVGEVWVDRDWWVF